MKLKLALCALVSLALSATVASAYEGRWYYDDNPGDYEYVELGDSDDNTFLMLRGYRGACGPRGDSYATMRRTLDSAPYGVVWWIDNDCGRTVRICLRGGRGQVACSTYLNAGWWLDEHSH